MEYHSFSNFFIAAEVVLDGLSIGWRNGPAQMVELLGQLDNDYNVGVVEFTEMKSGGTTYIYQVTEDK